MDYKEYEMESTKTNTGKLRLLYIYKLLEECTDEDHTLSTNQLIKELSERYGISSHRTTITTDIKLLKQYGFDIGVIESTQNKYYLASRQFENAEVQMLIDAVASSKFITEKKSRELIRKLTTLLSPAKSRDYKCSIGPDERIKMKNESILYIVDALDKAINDKCKVSFEYFTYDENKKRVRKNGGKPYIFSPWSLIWNGDYYYAVGWSEKHDGIGCFRVDRMWTVPAILEDKAVPQTKGFNPAEYVKINYHMFGAGDICMVKLRCASDTMDAIIDRFGYDVVTEPLENGEFMATVTVAVNSVFFGWVFGFDRKVFIDGPKHVVDEYNKMIGRAL